MGFSIGGLVSGIFGSENKEKAQGYNVDANNYAYGGAGGADEAANRYRQQAEAAQGRQGAQVDYSQANWDRMQAGQARQGQQTIADAMGRRALGQVPSIAQMQADRQMGQAVAAQQSAAASARGAGGMALAQQNAANNIAGAQSAISNQAQINAAQERMAAEQSASQAYGALRGGDLASQQQAAQQSQFQAGLQQQQNALNDQMTLGMSGLEHGVRTTQLGAKQNYEAQQSANALGAQGINAGVGGQNAAMNQQNAWGVIGMGRDMAGGAAAMFGKRAAGGPVGGQQPYLVGERGPELVVPAQNGYVIPADQTREILKRSEGGPMTVDMGGGGGMTADQIRAGLTGRVGGAGIAGMVGGGGVTGGGGTPGGAGVVPLAEGGPMTAFQPVQSTWGVGGPDIAAQQQAVLDAQVQGAVGREMVRQADAYENPYARDVRQVQALRQLNPELVSEEDDARERRGLAMMGMQRKDDAAKAKPEAKKDGEKKPEQPAKKEDTIDRMLKSTPAQYQAMGGYVAPNLIQPRANGGPVQGSFDVLPLYEPEGQQLHVGDDGRAYLASAAEARPSLSGIASMSAKAAAPPLVARIPVASKAEARKMSEEEMMREAEKLFGQMSADHQARMAAGPAVRGLAAMKK